MYFDSDVGSKGSHIWRQPFPNGAPQQLTTSLGDEQGLAMAADGRSLVTSVGTSERSIWMHDREGERQVSSQGLCHTPRFSSDGTKLFYLQEGGASAAYSWETDRGSELLVLDLATGQASKVLPGIAVLYYAVSPDAKRVVFETLDASGQHVLWVSSTEHRFAPRQIHSPDRRFIPQYAPSGRIYYAASAGGHAGLYRMNDDGTQEERVTSEPIDYVLGISPDERFVVVNRTLGVEDNGSDAEAVPLAGGPLVPVCSGWCDVEWARDGKVMYFHKSSFTGNARTYVVPIPHGSDLPKLPKSGFQSEKELRAVATQVLEGNTAPGRDSSQYAYSKGISHRNLYRIPLQ